MNLARSYRPKIFSEIVGQDLVKSMLQNGLFLNKFFPAYIFAGQRGCGKTTTARIFASALNCHILDDFRKFPKKFNLPCLTCESCLVMSQGRHPDFFELDAASNTGVDNIRQILETTSYQPALGQKRIFLIDEAHMLSKAAFAALLKTLEEPPSTVVFLLATTELDKIPTTIRSRSFLGLFGPIPSEDLSKYLIKIAEEQKIKIEPLALQIIVKLSQGCLRDSLNLLDQLGSQGGVITESLVQQSFGFLDVSSLINLFNYLADNDLRNFNHLWHSDLKNRVVPANFFSQIANLILQIFNLSLNIFDDASEFGSWKEDFLKITAKIGKNSAWNLLQKINIAQVNFSSALDKHLFLEMLLLELFFVVHPQFSEKPILTEKIDNIEAKDKKVKILPEKKVESGSMKGQSLIDVPRWHQIFEDSWLQKEKLLFSGLKLVENAVILETEKVIKIELGDKANIFLQKQIADSSDKILSLFLKAHHENRDISLDGWRLECHIIKNEAKPPSSRSTVKD